MTPEEPEGSWAIDFMIMPLSRYLSGDFITPTMQFAWQLGLPYSLVGPGGVRKIPKDTPFGGLDAPVNRARFVPMLLEDLKALPGSLPASLWDEASTVDPTFHRVDPRSYETLQEEARSRRARPSFLGLLGRPAAGPPHLCASVFLPVAFDATFDMPVVLEGVAGSAPQALRELHAGGWSDAASSARDTLRDALDDAVRLRLPMIVDV